MADFKITDISVARDIPGNPAEKGGPAKVLKLTLEGDERQPELFTTAKTAMPQVGQTIADTDIQFNEQFNRWEIARKGRSGSGGGGKSPAQEKRIVRQHSQEMALQRERNLLAAGGRLLTDEQLEMLVGWFEADAYGKQKQGVIAGVMTSDVPGDDSGLP